jgi:hypothetical protein
LLWKFTVKFVKLSREYSNYQKEGYPLRCAMEIGLRISFAAGQQVSKTSWDLIDVEPTEHVALNIATSLALEKGVKAR